MTALHLIALALLFITLIAALLWRAQRIHEKQRKDMHMARVPTPPPPPPPPPPSPPAKPASDD